MRGACFRDNIGMPFSLPEAIAVPSRILNDGATLESAVVLSKSGIDQRDDRHCLLFGGKHLLFLV